MDNTNIIIISCAFIAIIAAYKLSNKPIKHILYCLALSIAIVIYWYLISTIEIDHKFAVKVLTLKSPVTGISDMQLLISYGFIVGSTMALLYTAINKHITRRLSGTRKKRRAP